MEKINVEYNSINTSPEKQRRFSMFNLKEAEYKNFIKKMEKSEFKNAYTRFLTEISILKGMQKYAKEEGLSDKEADVTLKIEEIKLHLKEQFGIVVN